MPTFGERSLEDITTRDLDRFYQALTRQKGLSPATIRQIHAIIRRAFRQAEMWGWVSANPAINATPPRLVKPDLSPPDVEQVGNLIRAATQCEPCFGHFVHLAATTGARRGELCALRWGNVNFETGELLIERALVEVEGGLVEKDSKTHQARRLALDPATVDVLRAQRAIVEKWAVAANLEIIAESYVFSWEPDGMVPWAPDSVSGRFERLRAALGLQHVQLHDLRHFAATRLMAAGAPVRTVSGRLGHANPSTTLAVYSHFVQASDREFANVLGSMVSDAKRDDGASNSGVPRKGVAKKESAPKRAVTKKAPAAKKAVVKKRSARRATR